MQIPVIQEGVAMVPKGTDRMLIPESNQRVAYELKIIIRSIRITPQPPDEFAGLPVDLCDFAEMTA